MYENEKLRQIFQSPFSKSTWNSILLEIVKAKDLRIVPEEIDVPEDCTKGFYLGEQDRNDAYRIGLFLYEVRRGNIARKRVGLRNLVRNYINSSGAFDAALVVFTDGTLWRLSFICDIKELATAPKRFTFVFGDPQNRYRTAIERFQILQEKGVTFESLKEAFSVEALSKEFFGQYKEHYLRFCDFIYENANNKKFFGEEFAKWNANAGTQKYIRDYVKNLLGRIVFLQFLQKKGWMGIPENHKTWTGGDTNFLYNLYDKASLAQKNNFLDEILEPLFFDCLNTKREGDVYDTKVAAVGRVKIPYLNGGLFEQKDIDLPKSVFPREMFGDLLDFFTQYNFTIDENDPNDAEIGVDPEMLGKIFENLLEDNKDKGAFYTPKEIVQYMCRESIDAYLRENKNVGKSELGLLKQVKVCDPAIGSGAFPMGILNELYRRRLELGETMRAEIKREIIQKNIYGVDIEQGAVDIARLRFWLALVVDSEKPEPLPNLDYKIMQGNSLLEQYKGEDLSKLIKPKKYYDKDGNQVLFSSAAATQMTFFDDINDIDKEKLSNLVSTYYSSHENKQSLREQIKENVISQLCTTGVNKSIISALEKMKIHANSEFFLWHTWFAEVFADGGFDIVIGNPPYVSTKGVKVEDKKVYEAEFGFSDDTYNLFTFKGLQLTKAGGTLNYIIPKTFWTIQTKRNMRDLILDRKINYIFDTADPFESAMVDTCVIQIQNSKADKNHKVRFCDGSKDLHNPIIYTPILQEVYRNTQNSVIFKPTEHNLKIYELYGKKVKALYDKWWDKIKTSKDIEKNRAELERYRASLKPGDVALLGCLTEGGQGLATANNGKYIAVRKSTKWAANIIASRPKKLAEAYKKVNGFTVEGLASPNFAKEFLETKSEKEIADLFDLLKEKYGRDIFGQGYIYKLIDDNELADVDSLTSDEKENGIETSKKYYVPYDKGDKDGNRWYLETPFAIAWSRENVQFLKTNSGKKGQGMPVVRNPQFYFREGFTWIFTLNENAEYQKSRIKPSSVNDVNAMSLFTFSDIQIPPSFYVCLLNSYFIFKYKRDFINSTSAFQINDARQLPVIIPTVKQLSQFKDIFNKVMLLKKNSNSLSELKILEKQLDLDVMQLYGI